MQQLENLSCCYFKLKQGLNVPEAVCRFFIGLSQGGLLCCQFVYSVYYKRLSSLGWIEQVKSILQTDMEGGVCSVFMTYVDITSQNIFVHTFLQSICLQRVPYLMAITNRSGQGHLGMANLSSSFVRIVLGTSEVFTAWNFFAFFFFF